MGNLDRKIDFVTGDYVAASGGAFELCEVIENQIAASLHIALGSWEGAPDFGNRFGELARGIDIQEKRKRLEALARDALGWLVVDGLLQTVDVRVEQYAPGRVAFAVDAYRPGERDRLPLPAFLVPIPGGG